MSLLERVIGLLRRRAPLARDKSGEGADPELQLAIAGLLLETAYGDAEYVPEERKTILRGIERELGLASEEALRLLERAERSRPQGGDLSSISTRITRRYDLDQRKRIAALLWRVVYADRVLDRAEEIFANRVMDLAGLSREEAEEARLKAFVWFSEIRAR